MRFWDTSAIIPLFIDERSSSAVQAAYSRDPEIVVWWGTRVECSSAVARLQRTGLVSTSLAAASQRALGALAARWREVEPSERLREAARRLVSRHPLRAADALQLAAARVAAEQRPTALKFVCLDDRLAHAAEREGFPLAKEVLPP